MNGPPHRCALVRLSGGEPFARCRTCRRTLLSCFVFRTTVLAIAMVVMLLLATALPGAGGRLATATAVILLIVQGVVINRETDNLVAAEHQARQLLAQRDALLEDLNANLDFLAALFDSINEGIMVIDPQYRIVRANHAAVAGHGLDPESCVGKRCHLVSHGQHSPCQGPDDPCPVVTVFESGEPQRVVHRHPGENGESHFVEISATPFRDRQGKIAYVIEVMRDITHRQRAEAALAREKELLAVILASIADAVLATDEQGRIILANRAAEELLGQETEAMAGLPLDQVMPLLEREHDRPVAPLTDAVLASGQAAAAVEPVRFVRPDGERLLLASAAPMRDDDGRLTGVVVACRDVTQAEALEAEAARAQRLESLGLLAGGIAHDFNNLLAAILGNLSLLRLQGDEAEKRSQRLDAMEEAVRRARHLTMQLLTFAKGGEPVKQHTDLAAIVQGSVDLSLRGSNVQCRVDLAPDLWPVEADPNQLGQVCNNLLLNADQAMPEGGVILVHGRNIQLTAESGLPLEPGPYVRLSVTDEGVGIRPEHLERIFDPYFSTKERGHGIGLATSFSIVRRHKGLLSVSSEPGRGTTFFVYLPAAPNGARPAAATAGEPAGQSAALPRHDVRVLVMDDEAMVRETVAAQLETLGCRVTATADGEAAVAAYQEAREAGDPFAFAILDLTVPGAMGGEAAATQILEADPAAILVLASGYGSDTTPAAYRRLGFQELLQKPFGIDELRRLLQRLPLQEAAS